MALQLSQAVQDRAGAASKLIRGPPAALAGCWPGVSVACSIDLSVELLTRWQPAHLRARDSEREGERGWARRKPGLLVI